MRKRKKSMIAILLAISMLFSLNIQGVQAEETEETSYTDENTGNLNQQSNPAEEDEQNDTELVIGWNWVDEDKLFQWSDENGRWEVSFPGVNERTPLTKDALMKLLPKAIRSDIDGESKEIDIDWDLSELPDTTYKGEYVIAAVLPEGYEMAEEVAALNAVVVLDGAVSLMAYYGEPIDAPENLERGVSPKGTTINLFDYWNTERTSSDQGKDELDAGINANHQMKFLKAGNGAGINDNNTSGPRQGMVKNTLENGYPTLRINSNIGIAQEESLDYLFDDSDEDNPQNQQLGKKAFLDVQNLLQVDNKGYFYYDCEKNFASFDEDRNAFILYKQPAVYRIDGPVGQFFPFLMDLEKKPFYWDIDYEKWDGTTDPFQEDVWSLKADDGVTSNHPNLNHYFGLTMSTRFIQQYGGHVEENGAEAVTYEFSGDDDVWVFIDDVLVADLGGIHGKASLKIDFASGNVQINGQDDGTLKSKFESAGKSVTGFNGNTFSDNTYHTLKFFYLERGNSASNMSLKFNFVTIPETDIIKVDQTGQAVAGAEFELWKADENYNTVEDGMIAEGVTDADGIFILQDKNGALISLKTLMERDIEYLVLKETKVPDGYRSAGDMKLYLYKVPNKSDTEEGNVLLLADEDYYWSTGSYAVTKEIATAPNELYDIYGNEIKYESNGTLSGTMFSVVLKYDGNGTDLTDTQQWHAVYGDPIKGWTVVDGTDINAILTAAKANPYIYTVSSNGAYQNEIDNLPGDPTKYYFTLSNEDKAQTKFTVGHYYTTADSLEDATADNTVRIDSDDAMGKGHKIFGRDFAANLYVPNIKNRLLVQKLDQGRKPVSDSATFSLYKAEDVTIADDGTITINNDAKAYDTVTTRDIHDGNLNLDGGGVFPTGTKTLDVGEEYYLAEKDAPEGYQRNETITKIIVDETGVYADAGEIGDGVQVARGVGSIVKSMAQFATNDAIDSTLYNITATLQTSGGKTSDGWKWATSIEDVRHLVYDTENAGLEYAPAEGEKGLPIIEVDEGWSKLLIQQCDESHQQETPKGNYTELGETDLTNLFSRTTIVRVENQKIGTLVISKEVEGDGVDEKAQFEFEVQLTTGNGVPITGKCTVTRYSGEGTSAAEDITFDADGKATVQLKAGEKLEITELEEGVRYTVTEKEYSDYTTKVSVNNIQAVESNKAVGSISEERGGTVRFINIYADEEEALSFIKTDREGNPISGAEFVLYEFTCTNTGHSDGYHDELLEVDENGNIREASKYKGCFTLKETVASAEGTETVPKGLVEFDDIELGVTYRLIEYKAPGGYVLPNGQWAITVRKEANGELTLDFEVEIGNPPAFRKLSDEEAAKLGAPYSVINYKPDELPITGNRGIRIFLLAGGILMTAAAGWYIWQKKYGGRRHHRARAQE